MAYLTGRPAPRSTGPRRVPVAPQRIIRAPARTPRVGRFTGLGDLGLTFAQARAQVVAAKVPAPIVRPSITTPTAPLIAAKPLVSLAPASTSAITPASAPPQTRLTAAPSIIRQFVTRQAPALVNVAKAAAVPSAPKTYEDDPNRTADANAMNAAVVAVQNKKAATGRATMADMIAASRAERTKRGLPVSKGFIDDVTGFVRENPIASAVIGVIAGPAVAAAAIGAKALASRATDAVKANLPGAKKVAATIEKKSGVVDMIEQKFVPKIMTPASPASMEPLPGDGLPLIASGGGGGGATGGSIPLFSENGDEMPVPETGPMQASMLPANVSPMMLMLGLGAAVLLTSGGSGKSSRRRRRAR